MTGMRIALLRMAAFFLITLPVHILLSSPIASSLLLFSPNSLSTILPLQSGSIKTHFPPTLQTAAVCRNDSPGLSTCPDHVSWGDSGYDSSAVMDGGWSCMWWSYNGIVSSLAAFLWIHPVLWSRGETLLPLQRVQWQSGRDEGRR